MTGASWGVPPHLLDQVFPFHLALDSDLRLRQVGSSLHRLCPGVVPGVPLEQAMEVVSPRGPVTHDSLRSRPRSLFVLRTRSGELTLRGQILHDEMSEVLLFLGSPWITELASIADLGLTLEDFSVSDNIVDYLLLLQTQGTALLQARRLADGLRDSAAQLEAQARERERVTRQLESVLHSAGEGIYGLDPGGRITFVNETAARLLGRPREDLVGRSAEEAVPMECALAEGQGRDPVEGHGRDPAGDGGEPVTGRLRRADGSWFDSERISAPIMEDGAVAGSVVVFRDVTERRAVERLKDEFVSTVSHELRTPLTSIRGALGLLEAGAAGELPQRAARMVEVAATSADRLIRLVNDILEIERMAVGKLVITPQSTGARRLLETAAAEMAGLAQSARVSIRIAKADGTVWADPDRVVQTLNNLIGNAVKFSPAGAEVALSSTLDQDEVRFDVRDHGSGIPHDQLETVFEQFRQVDGSDARATGGTGLGLAICRGLVEQHGGRIWLASGHGEGTTASFTLPVAPAKSSR